MDEEKITKDTPEDNSGEGVQPETTSLYERTNTATERLEKANSKTEELLKRQEQLYEKQQLGGKADAGKVPEEPKEETPTEYMKKVMANDV